MCRAGLRQGCVELCRVSDAQGRVEAGMGLRQGRESCVR